MARALGVTPDDVVQNIGDPKYFTPGASAEVYPEWLSVRGTLQPGAAGFRLLRTDPDPADPQAPRPPSAAQDPKTRLEVLFNLVGYQLVATPGFRASADGLPAGPARQASGPLNHQLTAVGDAEPWIYARQLRIDRFAAGCRRRPGRAAGPVRRRWRPGPVRLAAAGRVRQPAAGPAAHRRRRRLHRRPDRRSASGRPLSPATASPGTPGAAKRRGRRRARCQRLRSGPRRGVRAGGGTRRRQPAGRGRGAGHGAPGPLRRRLLAAVARPGRRGDHDRRQHRPPGSTWPPWPRSPPAPGPTWPRWPAPPS